MKSLLVLMIALVALIGVTDVEAVTLLRFDNPTVDGGTLAYDGSGGSLIGTDIIFQNILCQNCPLNSSTELFILDGKLNFITGANTLEGVGLNTWDGGGSFVLTGTVNTASDGSGTDIASGVLLTGTFDDPVVGLATTQLLISGTGVDEKNADLLAFYGLTGFEFAFANTDIAADFTRGANGSLAGVVSESDITNTGSVPSATSLLMIGLGAVMVGASRFRKFRT